MDYETDIPVSTTLDMSLGLWLGTALIRLIDFPLSVSVLPDGVRGKDINGSPVYTFRPLKS